MNIDEFNKNGIIKVKKFLNQEETCIIQDIIRKFQYPKGDPNSHYSINIKQQFYKIVTFKFEKYSSSNFFLKIFRRKKILEQSKLLLKHKCRLNMIDAYYSKISDLPVLPWHCDQAYNGAENVDKFSSPLKAKIKFFIYLSNVGPNNGCTSYIPGSHKITFQIRKAIFEKKLKYTPFWSLKNLENFLKNNENYDYFVFNKKLTRDEIDSFLKKIDFLNNNEKSNLYDFKMEPGDAIIFDEGGVHRGSKILHNDRMVLRYLLSRDF